MLCGSESPLSWTVEPDCRILMYFVVVGPPRVSWHPYQRCSQGPCGMDTRPGFQRLAEVVTRRCTKVKFKPLRAKKKKKTAGLGLCRGRQPHISIRILPDPVSGISRSTGPFQPKWRILRFSVALWAPILTSKGSEPR